MTPIQIFLKSIRLILVLFFFSFFVFILLAVSSLSYISRSIGKSPNYLIETFYNSLSNNPYQSQDKINFLILGLDPRNDELEKTNVTDTIIFASLNLKSFKINLISTPRDLWSYQDNIKINGLYPLALESDQDKFDFLKDSFQKIYGQKIDHVVVINTDNLINFVDLIGGVDLFLEKGFTDNMFPNPDYIKNPSPQIPIYKTIEFPSGQLHLDATNVSEFVRSRKGSETSLNGGTDIGRIERQQLLIEAILEKLKSGDFINNPNQVKQLYLFWDQQISKSLSDLDVLHIIFALNQDLNHISFNKIDIPIGQNSTDGIIYHPTRFINQQWVFIPSDPEYKSFQDFIKDSIN